LVNGQGLTVSGLHPDQNGNALLDYKVGDELDGIEIESIQTIVSPNTHTLDILPSGETGVYWANGILIGSTLFDFTGQLSEN